MKVLDVDSPFPHLPISPHPLGRASSLKGLSSAHSARRLFERTKTDVIDKTHTYVLKSKGRDKKEISDKMKNGISAFEPNLVDELWETEGASKA